MSASTWCRATSSRHQIDNSPTTTNCRCQPIVDPTAERRQTGVDLMSIWCRPTTERRRQLDDIMPVSTWCRSTLDRHQENDELIAWCLTNVGRQQNDTMNILPQVKIPKSCFYVWGNFTRMWGHAGWEAIFKWAPSDDISDISYSS
jgi:hypothetical protein